MNRQDLQNLALTRLEEVEVLLNNHKYSGAYYLSGYVIECALKACIAKQTQEFDYVVIGAGAAGAQRSGQGANLVHNGRVFGSIRVAGGLDVGAQLRDDVV